MISEYAQGLMQAIINFGVKRSKDFELLRVRFVDGNFNKLTDTEKQILTLLLEETKGSMSNEFMSIADYLVALDPDTINDVVSETIAAATQEAELKVAKSNCSIIDEQTIDACARVIEELDRLDSVKYNEINGGKVHRRS